jgi:hypothetical protein
VATPEEGITRELSLSEVVSKTFELCRRNFVKYTLLFLAVEVIIGLVSVWAYGTFSLPTLPANATNQNIVNWAGSFFTNLIYLVGAVGIVSLVFGTIAYGSTIKMASEEVENKPVDLGGAVRFAASKMLWMWVLGIVLGIIIGLGFIALVVPGIILAIMFSVSFQALLIESAGVGKSLGRSRELVSHRWLKTFAVFLVFAIIVAIAAAIVDAIGAPFGYWSHLVSSVLSAFYQPIIPVATTVYFYSNRARVAPTPQGPTSAVPAAMPAPGMKFCPNCGAQLLASATFCSNCGAKQPAQL